MLTRKDILSNDNSSLTTISYPQNTKPYSLYTIKLICFLFLIFSVLAPVQSICDPSNHEDHTSIDTMFCNPKEGEEYEIGQDVLLSWNPDNAYLFDSAGTQQVKVYLIRMRQNLTGYEEIVSLDPGNSTDYISVPRDSNSMNLTVELGWLPKYNYSIPVKEHTFLFRVIPSDSEDELNRLFSTPTFEVMQPDPPSTATASDAEKPIGTEASTESQPNPTVTVSPTSLDSNRESNSENKVLIVVIAVASLAAFLAFIAIVIAICSRKRNKHPTMIKSQSNLSTSSSAPIVTPLSMSKFDHDSESPIEAESIYSTTPLSNKEEMRSKPKVSFSNENQPISASDAALLSDAFRKVLRKPDWKPEDEEEEDVNLSNEERVRRREAKELMKKELAEEGTDLQSLSRRHTKVEIHNIGDEPEKDGSSHSSESGSK